MSSRRVLVTGGVRSGKSRYAESLLAEGATATYVAPGARPDPAADPEWAARVEAHQAHRPAGWTTVETIDLAAAIHDHPAPLIIDCLGTWLTATIDAMGVWDTPLEQWRGDFAQHLDATIDAWKSADGLLIAVTNEVGWGLVSEHRSGRVFTDLLGQVNQAFAAASDDVMLVVAGRVLHL